MPTSHEVDPELLSDKLIESSMTIILATAKYCTRLQEEGFTLETAEEMATEYHAMLMHQSTPQPRRGSSPSAYFWDEILSMRETGS